MRPTESQVETAWREQLEKRYLSRQTVEHNPCLVPMLQGATVDDCIKASPDRRRHSARCHPQGQSQGKHQQKLVCQDVREGSSTREAVGSCCEKICFTDPATCILARGARHLGMTCRPFWKQML